MRAAAAFLIFTAAVCGRAETIASAQAKDHIGQTAEICGKVVGTRYLDSSEKRPTFLNFDNPYPNHTFTAVIFGDDRAKFGKPEETYLQKSVCVSGKIEDYRGKPQVVLTDPKQIRMQ